MPAQTLLTDLAHTIQLAVAPVFLLMAIGTILSVLSTRLGRIVDRSRVLLAHRSELDEAIRREHNAELSLLSRRRGLINYAVTSATVAALQVCILIAAAFIGFMLGSNFSLLIAGLFIGAMAAFILALLLFLREILIAVAATPIYPLPRI
jgi:hypothetical protein